MSKETAMLLRAKAAYEYLYEDQKEGAEPEYLAFLDDSFGPAGRYNWANRLEASRALQSLVEEVYESSTEPEELLAAAGVDSTLAKFCGFDLDSTEPSGKSAESSAEWIAKLEEVFYRDDVNAILRKIPKDAYDEKLVKAICNKQPYLPYNAHKTLKEYAPEHLITEELLVWMYSKKPSDLKKLEDKSIITRSFAEKLFALRGGTCLSFIPMSVRREPGFLETCLTKDPRSITGIPASARTTELCEKAILAGIELCRKDLAVFAEYSNHSLFERQLKIVPGGPNALSKETKAKLVNLMPHTLRVFGDAGAFKPVGEDGEYSADAWAMFFAGLENPTSAGQMVMAYTPVHMVRRLCFKARDAGLVLT